jgi:hypothetical protein
VVPPAKPGLTVEIAVDDEVIGTLYQDVEDGEVSYSVNLSILEEDLPPAAKVAPAAPAAKAAPTASAAKAAPTAPAAKPRRAR